MGVFSIDCDILIVGGGIAGLRAALTARENAPRKKVVVADLGGGASSEVMGFCAPMGAEDSPECFIEDTLRAGAGENNPAIVERLCRDARGVVAHLESLGISFDKNPDGSYAMLRSLGSTHPRVVHYKTITGKTAIEKYLEILHADPLVEFHKTRVVKLFERGGRITGALGFNRGAAVVYNAPCVVLAAGGGAGLYAFSTWTKMLQGSAYAMALDLGVELIGINRVQFEPCVAVYPEQFKGFPIITTMLFEGAQLVDAKGRQLISPDMPNPTKRVLAETIARAVADGGDCGHGGVWFDFSGVEESLFETKYPEYYKKLRGITANYSDLRVEVKPAAHTTMGGVKVDANCATSVAGLFAAGEAMGGVHGRDRIGGNAGLEVFVFGRAAGLSAAAYSAEPIDISGDCRAVLAGIPAGKRSCADILAELGGILDKYAGVYRTPEGSAECAKLLDKMERDLLADPPDSSEHFMICRNSIAAAKSLSR